MVETLRSIVHEWECDSVEHFTTGYYFESFNAANWAFLNLLGYDEDGISSLTPASCQTRFSKELRGGDPYHLVSGVIRATDSSLTIGHKLLNSETGELCAAHAQIFEGRPLPVGDEHRIEWESAQRDNKVDVDALKTWSRTSCSLVRRDDLDLSGRLDIGALIHHTSDANVQFQNRIGMTSSYMREARIGFSTIGYEIGFAALPARAGAVIETSSALAHIGRSSLWFAHRVTDQESKSLVATVVQYGVHLDRAARRPSEIPECIRDRAQQFQPGSA